MAMPSSNDPLREARKAVSHFTDKNTEAQDDKCESFKVAWEAVKEQNLCLPAPKPFLLSVPLCLSMCSDRIGSIGWGFKPSTRLLSEFLLSVPHLALDSFVSSSDLLSPKHFHFSRWHRCPCTRLCSPEAQERS